MSGELINTFSPNDWFREMAVGYDAQQFKCLVPPSTPISEITAGGGQMVGVSFQKNYQTTALGYTYPIADYYNSTCTIPANITLTTGVTFQFRITDDGTNPTDLGLVCQFGLTLYNMDGSGFLTSLSVDGGTEVTANVTLSSTSLAIVSGSIAILNANMASAAVGNQILLRLRRVGTAAADTCPGRVVMISSTLKNT